MSGECSKCGYDAWDECGYCAMADRAEAAEAKVLAQGRVIEALETERDEFKAELIKWVERWALAACSADPKEQT